METYILMPEREFEGCQEKVPPNFADSNSIILKKPFINLVEKAEALQTALQ
jgi:hypothetical protein